MAQKDRCPDCGGTFRVVDSRVVNDGETRVRKKECNGCGNLLFIREINIPETEFRKLTRIARKEDF